MNKNWVAFEEFERDPTESTERPEEEEGVFSTVEDAVRAARDEFDDNLELLDSALESAAVCPFRNPGRVYQVLQAINEVAQSWRTSLESKTSMGGGLVQAFKLKGCDFKKDISQTCRTRFEDDYMFMYHGDRHMFAQHITEGSGNPNSCFSVHMLFDQDAKKVVIAYVGIHRRNTST
jgi:hypothetical protein